MNLIGTRYTTFHDGAWLVKSQDLVVPDRLPVVCYREALACTLGTRVGLAIPATSLIEDRDRGRIARQAWLSDARTPSSERIAQLKFESLGIRILLLDLLVANSDRRIENLLERGDVILPIDYNVAFSFAREEGRAEAPDLTIMRWFGTVGVLMLAPDGLERLTSEITRFQALLDEAYIRFSVAQLPAAFLGAPERQRLEQGLLDRRATIGMWIRDWWNRTVEPLHRLNEATHD